MADAVKGVYDLVNSEKKKESSSIEPKEFFWDQFIKYIASAILALSVLNVTVEFLRGGGVSCFPPSDNVGITAQDLEGRMLYEFGQGQTSYINNYCARNVPNTEYFPIYILIHGLLLIVPHYIWNALHNGDFDSFFLIVDKLDRLRDSTTGEYDTNNFDRVTKLEQEYSGRKIYYTYILKLVLQLIIVCGSVILSALYFKNFSFVFFCPGDSVDDFTCPEEHLGTPCGWPLNVTVPCVYTSLRVLNLVRYADFFLLAITAGLVLYGLGWCVVRHTEQLGFSELANFSFLSCLKPDNFVFPPVVSWPTYSRFTSKKGDKKKRRWIERFWLVTHYPKINFKHIFKPRILHDFDFLLLALFRADNSHGEVFKDIQTSKELKKLVGRDHQLLHLFINIQQDLPDFDFYSKRKKRSQKVQRDPTSNNPRNPNASSDSTGEQQTTETTPNGSSDADPSSDSTGCFRRLFRWCQNAEETDSETDTDNEDEDQEPQANPHDKRALHHFHDLYRDAGFTGNAEDAVFKEFESHLGEIRQLKEHEKSIRDVIHWFVNSFGPKNPNSSGSKLKRGLALDITFGSIGYSLILARAFMKVVSVQFQPHYQNTSKTPIQKDVFYTNYETFKFPDNLYSQSTESITGAQQLLLHSIAERDSTSDPRGPPPTLDFIMIGPITEESKLVSVNLLLNSLYGNSRIGKDAILLAIRPLKVGLKKVLQRFFKFKPSRSLFDSKFQRKMVIQKLPPKSCRTVDRFRGIKVECGTTSCVFEMIAYKFIGKVHNEEQRLPEIDIPESMMPGQLSSTATTPQQPTDRSTSIDSGTFSPITTEPPQLLNETQATTEIAIETVTTENAIQEHVRDKNRVSERQPLSRQN